MADETEPTYSISFRLRRTTTEFAFVKVLVAGDLVIEQPDGTGRLDVDAVVRRALELGHGADVTWHPETREVEPHPIQSPPPGVASDIGDNSGI